ncbi:MAG TPA: hypothetical protein VGU64_20025 [Terriglobales bacterium]|nr:hypothetical protein [Terriglobales bacterium]
MKEFHQPINPDIGYEIHLGAKPKQLPVPAGDWVRGLHSALLGEAISRAMNRVLPTVTCRGVKHLIFNMPELTIIF